MVPVTSRAAMDQAVPLASKVSVHDSMMAEKSFPKKAWTNIRVPSAAVLTPAVRSDTEVILRSSKSALNRDCSDARTPGLKASR